MNLTVDTLEDGILITLDERRLDAAIATRFKDRMRDIVTKGRVPVRIDMHHVEFMDSSGLGAMIAVHKAMPAGVPLALHGLTPNVVRVFRLTRMDAVFTIVPGEAGQREKRA